ncbi:MAG: MMPL family transporter [Acidimicrobiales bacterium]
MKTLARFAVRRRWWMLGAWVALIIGTNAASLAVGSAFSNTFTLPGTNSEHAYALLSTAKGASGDVDEIVFQATSGTVASHRAEIQGVLAKVARLPVITSVFSPFCTGAHCAGQAQVSRDDRIAYAIVHFAKPGFRLSDAQIRSVEAVGVAARSTSLNVQFGGNAFGQLDSPRGSKYTVYGLLATAVVLVLAFGSIWAMLLPLGVALFALGVATAATTLLSHGLAIAQFAPILGSLIGLGVGIDYALFIVTRSRQGLRRGFSVEEAVVTSIDTSGRAVLFAGSTVCIALLGMLFLRLSFLNGVAVSATLTVAITMLASLTLLPSLLAFQKFRVLSRRERRALADHGAEPAMVAGAWQRWARFVSRHPRTLSAVALAAIVLIGLPFFSLRLGSSDQGLNPPSSTTRQAYDLLATGFGPGFNGPLSVVASVHGRADDAAMRRLDAALVGQPDVASVGPVIPLSGGRVALITVVPRSSPQAVATTNLIDAIRNATSPPPPRAPTPPSTSAGSRRSSATSPPCSRPRSRSSSA